MSGRDTASLSPSRQEYLRSVRRRRRLIVLCRWGLLAAVVLLWELGARLGFINDFLLSSPSRVAATVAGLWRDGQLMLHIGTTMLEMALGFIIGGLLGTLLAVALWWSDFLCKVMDVYIVVLNSLPKIALAPILIVWIGTGMKAIVAMAVLISVVVTLVTTLTGFQEVSREQIFLLRSFGASKRQVFTMVVLPGSTPALLAALKLNIGMSWVGVIVGEYLVSRAGLGYLIVYGGQVFRLDLVMASMVILCLLAVAMYFGVAWLEKRAKGRG